MKIWYNITVQAVETMMRFTPRDLGGFDRDILEWNIPECREFVVL